MNKHLLLGFDVGSSSVKASLVDVNSGECVATAFYPEHEAPIKSIRNGWAEQDPEMWWANAKLALARIMAESGAKGDDIRAIGISYQMHGLVCVDKAQRPVRDAIIWCDSRAVPNGERALPSWAATAVCRICSTRPATSPPPNWRGSRTTSPRSMSVYTR